MDENTTYVYLEKQVDDHESRLRRLEESDVQQRIQLTNIEKSQSDIKLMLSEQSKEQQRVLNDFTRDTIGYFKEKDSTVEKNKQEIKFYNTKQFWVVLSAIVTAIITGLLAYLGLK